MGSHDGEDEELPPPPPVPPDVIPIKAEDAVGESPAKQILKPKRLLMDRPGIGRKGQPTQLYSNHFKVAVKSTEDVFFHYYVCLLTEFMILCSKYVIVCPLFITNLWLM
jgi:eukaryotic translation initiation factor 2C